MKRFFTFFAAVCCFAMMSMAQETKQPDGAQIRFCNQYMTTPVLMAGDMTEIKKGLITYDSETHTLTLDNVTLEMTEKKSAVLTLSCSKMEEGSRINIQLIGSNYLKATYLYDYGIAFYDGNFTISGMGGKLFITTNQGGAITTSDKTTECIIENGAYVYAGYIDGSNKSSFGLIRFGANITVNCATLIANGEDYSIGFMDPILNDAAVTMSGYHYDNTKNSWVDGSSNIIKGKEIEFVPTKQLFWAFPENPAGGTVTIKKDGNPVANPYRYELSEVGSTLTIEATPATGWEFEKWDWLEAQPADVQAKSTTVEIKAGNNFEIATFRYSQPTAPTKKWYDISNLYKKLYQIDDIATGAYTEAVDISSLLADASNAIICSAWLDNKLYFMEKSSSGVGFYKADLNIDEEKVENKTKLFDPQSTYQYVALTYSFYHDAFLAIANNGSDQLLIQISSTGAVSVKHKILNVSVSAGNIITMIAADKKGNIYVVGHNYSYFTDPTEQRQGDVLYTLNASTGKLTYIGRLYDYSGNTSNAMAFDYKTQELVASLNCGSATNPHLCTIDTKTGRATRLGTFNRYSCGFFQMTPPVHKVTVGVKSGQEDMGTAAILDNGKTEGRFMEDDEYAIEAFPKTSEYRFVKWEDGETKNPRELKMGSEDVSYTAVFDWAEGITTYPIWIDSKQFNSAKLMMDNSNNTSIASGYATFDPATKTLLLNTIDAQSDNIVLTVGDKEGTKTTLTIRVEGHNDMNTYGTADIKLINADVTFVGDGVLSANSYYTSSALVLDKANVTFEGVIDVRLTGNAYGIVGTETERVTFRGANMKVSGETTAIGKIGSMVVEYCSITNPTGAEFKEANHQVEDAGGVVKGGTNPVIFVALPILQGYCLGGNDAAGSFTMTCGTESFTNIGWFNKDDEVTVTAVPASGFEFAYWDDDTHKFEPDHADFIPATRTIKKTDSKQDIKAMFYYKPKSKAQWYGVNQKTFVGFKHADHAYDVAKATFPAGDDVRAGEYDGSAWIFQDKDKLKSMPLSGITDGEKIVEDASSITELGTITQKFTDMAYDYTKNKMYAVDANKLYLVDYKANPAKVEEVGECYFNLMKMTPISIAIDASGTIYILAYEGSSLHKVTNIDTEGKKVTLEPVNAKGGAIGEPVFNEPQSIAFDHVTGELFWGDVSYLRIIDVKTGTTSVVGDLGHTEGNQKAIIAMHHRDKMVSVTVKIATGMEEMGSVQAGKSKVFAGTKATITATPKSGYEFTYWTRDIEDDESHIEGATHSYTASGSATWYAHFKKSSQDVDNVTVDTQASKILLDGQIYIIRDGKMYTITGAVVK